MLVARAGAAAAVSSSSAAAAREITLVSSIAPVRLRRGKDLFHAAALSVPARSGLLE